ncbi:MAG: hypothetical protein L0Y72_25940 [Gemmataceae bacterium]|nr:hypothetical protein [Gemmataceae bacterium]MCI0742489.1 hypothetical protein [Gemmataceae bacterium]
MKAEQRKELETNALADRVGRMVTKLKTGQNNKTLILCVLGGAVLVVVFFFWMKSRGVGRFENAERWSDLEDGAGPYMDRLLKEHGATNQGKAATFQYAWTILWNRGVQLLGHGPAEALKMLDAAERVYDDLAKECEGDPVWQPEALYALAIIEETRTIRDRKHLELALDRYKELADKHKDSAYGKMAAARVEVLENPQSRDAILLFYQGLQQDFHVRDEKLPPLK